MYHYAYAGIIYNTMQTPIVKSQLLNLKLSHFRNYQSLEIEPKKNIISIIGHNGAGKTNILEAISLLQPGKGLRGSKLQDIDMRSHEQNTLSPWLIDCKLEGHQGVSQITTGHIHSENMNKRFVELDAARNCQQSELSKIVNISWLTPQMDQMFISGTSVRRALLDRIVSHFEPEYNKILINYEHQLKERLNILQQNYYDNDWVKIIENSIAENAIIIAESRVKVLHYLQEAMLSLPDTFYKATLAIEGFIENNINQMPAIALEQEFCEKLKQNRDIDRVMKRTNAGIHRSDLLVYSQCKGIKAEMCSTGEQKLLLVSLFLSEIIAQVKWKQQLPVVLLDDIAAHLDERKKKMILDMVIELGAQVWITTTDFDVYNYIGSESDLIKVENNKIKIC